MIDTKDLFWIAFDDELEKKAIAISPFLRLLAKGRGLFRGGKAWAGRTVGPAKAWAGKAVGPAKARFAQSTLGKWLGRHPRTSRALGFTGSASAAGAAMTAGEMPFRRRREIIQLLPEPGTANQIMRYGGRS